MINRLVIFILLIALIIFTKMLYATEANTNTNKNKGTKTNTVIFNSNNTQKSDAKNIDHPALNKSNFKIVGQAKFSVLFWDIYESTLLTTSGSYPIKNQQHQLLFEINYLKDISSNELIKRTKQQWQHIGIPANNYQAYIPELKRLWPDISKGDTLSLVIQNQHSVFYFNQQYLGIINDPVFGQRFIDIWLAKNTSQPKLRIQLLGNNTDD